MIIVRFWLLMNALMALTCGALSFQAFVAAGLFLL